MNGKDTTKAVVCRWASFYVVAGLLHTVQPLRGQMKVVTPAQWLPMVVYVTGLMTQTNVTTTGIAQGVGVVSHDALSRLLRDLG